MKQRVQPGTTAVDQYYLVVMERGPYLVYGSPPLRQYFMMPNQEHEIEYYKTGDSYPLLHEPAALCRCGASARKPFCDGAHVTLKWDSELTASEDPLLERARRYKGPDLTLIDSKSYCVFARFCDAKGNTWNLVKRSGKEANDLVVRQANHCPAGRLSAWQGDQPQEPDYPPSLGLIQDPMERASGPLWVRGGIPVRGEAGQNYEVRNRVALCRCGKSENKPFCDGRHLAARFHDGLPNRPHPDGEEF